MGTALPLNTEALEIHYMHVLDSPMELLDAFVAAASIFLSILLHMNSSALKTEQRQFGSKEGIYAM